MGLKGEEKIEKAIEENQSELQGKNTEDCGGSAEYPLETGSFASIVVGIYFHVIFSKSVWPLKRSGVLGKRLISM